MQEFKYCLTMQTETLPEFIVGVILNNFHIFIFPHFHIHMEYIVHLSKDKKLKKLIEQHQPMSLTKRKKVYIHLCGSIMSQQLSTKVADIIHKRFLALYGGNPTPEQILETPFETLRAIGLSNAKTNYVRNVAEFAIEKGMDYQHLNKMNNDEVIEYLTQ